MKISDSTNDQLMCMAAHRHCLDRRSYIGSCCREWLAAHWDQLGPVPKQVIVRDTLEWLYERAPEDTDIDTRGWLQFADATWARLCEEDRASVRRQFEWRTQGKSVEEFLTEQVEGMNE